MQDSSAIACVPGRVLTLLETRMSEFPCGFTRRCRSPANHRMVWRARQHTTTRIRIAGGIDHRRIILEHSLITGHRERADMT
jgi:hypothetical protein